MYLFHHVQHLFKQLEQLLTTLPAQHYVQPVHHLSGATIGQHVRHIIELYIELITGYPQGVIDYGQRKRDRQVETNQHLATEKIIYIQQNLPQPDKALLLVAEADNTQYIVSSYYREIVHNIDHSIHHMALLRVGLTELSSMQVPEDFGVAYSTIKFRRECAQ